MPKIALPTQDSDFVTEQNRLNGIWYTFFYGLWEYVRGSNELALGGILDSSIDSTSSSGSTDTDLVDYIFEKNQLKTNNDRLLYNFKGTYATNGNNKKLVLTFGSQTIFDTTALAVNGGAWIFEVEITTTGSSSQNIFVKAFYNNLSKTAFVSGTQDLSDNIAIKLTATGVSDGDLILKEYCFNLNPIT